MPRQKTESPNRPTPADVLEAMAELRREYGAVLPARVEQLSGAVRLACAAPGVAETWEDVRAKAHRLRGTAGSYGFVAVGEAAGEIEDAVPRAMLADPSERSRAVELIEAALKKMESPRAISHGPPSLPAGVLTSTSLLVVDDDEDFLRHIEAVGRQQLLKVHPARTREEALSAARPDAAIIDIALGGASDGFAVARDLRALPGCESLPFAIASAGGSVDNRIDATHAGASVFLTKPVDPYALRSAVQALLAPGLATRPRILAVDDDPEFLAALTAELAGAEMTLTTASDPRQTLDLLQELAPSLLLLDVEMPEISGLDLCCVLRADPRWRDLPILFFTARTDVATRVAAFEAGCTDYLPKPLVREELLARLFARLEHARVVRERAEHDPLTNLFSRRPFLEALTARVAEARRHGRPLAVCMLDLDQFKRINDTYGHLAGDRVLASLGWLLRARFRIEDLRGRWGGEEFALAFPGETADAVAAIMTRVLEEFRQLACEGDRGESFSASFSAGVASMPADGDSVDALLKLADRRLYEAKRAGRGRVTARTPA